MAAFVLVHGAWHGGWCWRRVVPLLRAAGHEVHAPTLTGLGERAHLLSPAVDLDTHTWDVAGLLACEDLRDVVLVGHSYGGMVITALAAREPDRLARLVYLDAFVPQVGECVFDLLAPDRAAAFREGARTEGEGWRVPSPPLERWGVTDPADVAWAGPRIGPQPIATFEQPLGSPSPALPRTYIGTEYGTFLRFTERARAEPGWTVRELPTGHDAMITMPRELAALLLEAAG
jgi:pimeloyl-ACP methyl ester carboxylesterase